MSSERLKASLAIPDLTDPRNGIHAINIIIEKIVTAMKKGNPDSSIEEIRGDPRVSIKDNFDDLLFPKDNAGRSSRYTRYVSEDTVLRTHMSSAAPSWLRKRSADRAQDTIAIFPGMCYRRDVVDRTHCGEPHQMDIWRIKRGGRRCDRKALIKTIETVLGAVVPQFQYRANEVRHPYTINGLEVEILVNDTWLEILECGEIHPTVLMNAGLDPDEYSGLALGMGLDRLVMALKRIDDIRILRSQNPRIKKQLMNLEPFVVTSNQPAAKRVISYSTSVKETEEDTCEKIRDGLGKDAVFLEQIEYAETPYEELPEKARLNLGIKPDQKNVVATITFRSIDGSLARPMVNNWIETLYPKLNQGSKGYI